MHDLLNDSLIGVRTAAGPSLLSLPALIAELLRREVMEYTGLRAHQADAWHILLVQLAASVLARDAGRAAPPADEAYWRAGLLDLADGCASAWHLLVENVTKPAFMQHPLVSVDDLTAFNPGKPKAQTPDELDVLVTAKDHDVKMARVRHDDVEAWLYALVTYQSMSGFLGRGNYGTVRMNGGFGSRCCVSLVVDSSPSARFVEELGVVTTMRPAVLAGGIGYRPRMMVTTWIRPWNREASQCVVGELEPWFVEAVRPVRLRAVAGGMVALGATSEARQVGPKTLESGDVGDPWTPINVADKKKGRSALTVSANGWTPERLADLIFERGYELTPLQRPRPGMSGTTWFVGSVLVRGQGTTEGFHRFAVPVPAKARSWLERAGERGKMGLFSEKLLKDAREVESTLRMALIALVEGGPQEVNFGNDTVARWAKAAMEGYALGWQDQFFPTVWRIVDEDEQVVTTQWRGELVTLASRTLNDAETRAPIPSARRYRSFSRANGLLRGGLHKKGLLPPGHHTELEEQQ
jgi:CRISPR system Cascade subunit CasA